jgi:hypothetical protein
MYKLLLSITFAMLFTSCFFSSDDVSFSKPNHFHKLWKYADNDVYLLPELLEGEYSLLHRFEKDGATMRKRRAHKIKHHDSKNYEWIGGYYEHKVKIVKLSKTELVLEYVENFPLDMDKIGQIVTERLVASDEKIISTQYDATFEKDLFGENPNNSIQYWPIVDTKECGVKYYCN